MHPRVLQQPAFHFHGVHIFPPDLEHVLVTPQEADVAILPGLGHVAGVEPPFGIVAVGGFLRLAVIALHQVVTLYHQFAGHLVRLFLPCFRVDHPAFVPLDGIARGFATLLFGGIQGGEHGAHAYLAHAIAGDGLDGRQHRSRLALDVGGAVHARGEESRAQAGHVMGGTLLRFDEVFEVGLKPMNDRHPFLLDQCDALVRVEGRRDHLPRPGYHGHHGPLRISEEMKQGQIIEDHVVSGDGHAVGPVLHIANDVVGVHHPLGKARRA